MENFLSSEILKVCYLVKKSHFLHDDAPFIKALQTHKLIRNTSINFLSSSEIPSCSPDLNVCENIDSILEDRVEERTENYNRISVPSLTCLRRVVAEMHRDMEFDSQLFCNLLKSYPSRMQAVEQAGVGHTQY